MILKKINSSLGQNKFINLFTDEVTPASSLDSILEESLMGDAIGHWKTDSRPSTPSPIKPKEKEQSVPVTDGGDGEQNPDILKC